MGRIVQYRATPGIERPRALDEAFAQCLRGVGLAVPFAAGVIAGHLKSIPVQHLEPSLDRDLPIRVLPEKPANDTQFDRLMRPGGFGKTGVLYLAATILQTRKPYKV